MRKSRRVQLYVVTGVSRLAGEREAVTCPHGLSKTVELRDRLARKQHSWSAYSRLRVEPVEREGDVFGG